MTGMDYVPGPVYEAYLSVSFMLQSFMLKLTLHEKSNSINELEIMYDHMSVHTDAVVQSYMELVHQPCHGHHKPGGLVRNTEDRGMEV